MENANQNSEVLFEIKREHLETGMRGFPVGFCTTSSVDPYKGLFYAEKSLENLAYLEPEEVIYLLFYGKQGNEEEVKQFKATLVEEGRCSSETIEHIQKLPRKGHPMKLFCSALLICGMIEGVNDYKKDCLNLIAKVPQIAATVINYHANWNSLQPSRPELGYMENFVEMLNVPGKNKDHLLSAFKLFNVLHYDHGGGNLSTFVGKAVASGLEDMYGSIVAAMCALAGPKHGRANQDCLEFINEMLKECGEDFTEERLEEILRDRLKQDKLVFGFGHAVLRVEDPRAIILYNEAQKQYPEHPLVKMALLLRKVGSKVLGENSKISDPYPNVDAISGTLLTAAGFPYPEYFTVLFGLSRVVGIAIQIVYERCDARGGKGTPIVRPKYLFKKREKTE